MTATASQVARFEARCRKARRRWQETLNPQQAAYLAANGDQVAHVEHAITEATCQQDRIAEFRQLLANYDITSRCDDAPSMGQAAFLLVQVAHLAPHILDDLVRALGLLEVAHERYVAGVRDATRHMRHEALLEDEVTRLTAELDQANAALRDREVTP